MLIYTSYPKCSFTRPIFKTLLNKTSRRCKQIFLFDFEPFWGAFGSKVKGKWKYKQQTHPQNTPNLPRLLACLLAALAPATTSRHTHTTRPTCHAKKPLKPLNNAHFNDTIWLIWTSFTKTSTKQNKLAYSTLSFRPHVLSMYSTSNSFDVLAFGEL